VGVGRVGRSLCVKGCGEERRGWLLGSDVRLGMGVWLDELDMMGRFGWGFKVWNFHLGRTADVSLKAS